MKSDNADVVILGSSIAGLSVAAALKGRFQNIVLVDRDPAVDPKANRPGTPQASHGHNLLTQGYRLFADLFPGWESKLDGFDVPHLDWGGDVDLLGFYDWHVRSPSQYKTRSLSRSLLETAIYKNSFADTKLRKLEGWRWEKIILSDDRTKVTGVVLTSGGESLCINATLVIDATGRSSRLPQMLRELGLSEVEVTNVDPKVTYASAIVHLKNPPAAKMVFITPKSMDIPTAAMLAKIENNQWMITLVGIGGLIPPTNQEKFIEFALRLRSPVVHEYLLGAEFLTPITLYGNTANRRRWYEKMSDFPSGLLAVGDSSVAFNPIYGQGMTVVAQQAVTLKEGRDGSFDRRLQGKISASTNMAWSMSTQRDAGIVRRINRDKSSAPRSKRHKASFAQRLMLKVAAGAAQSPLLRDAYLGIAHLTNGPISLLAPRVLLRALFQKLPPQGSGK